MLGSLDENRNNSAALIVERNGREMLRLALTGRGAKIGAHPRNDLCLPESGLDDYICEIVTAPRNGHHALACQATRLTINGKQTRKRLLKQGDRLTFGALEVRYIAANDGPRGLAVGATGQITISHDGTKMSVAEGLLTYQADGKQQRVPVTIGGLRLGKDEDNDLVLTDRSVSGFHALIFARGDRYFIRDLESTNGTLVNNLKVVESELPFGANLRVGRVELKFEKHVSERPIVPSDNTSLDDMVSGSPEMRRVFSLIERVAAHDVTVCINGETGTGKELVARALHRRSPRSDGPFVAINVSAIPSELVEDELFGHDKGAFTGADKLYPGSFEQAQHGTLFLDEIGELPMSTQPKLLRALESRQIKRVGGRETLDLDVRIVCATHRDLVRQVQDGKFREDLLHRIYILPINLPPLRDRRGDIDLLTEHFMADVDPTGRKRVLSVAAMRKLRAHDWRGNVRELRNVLVRAAMLSERDPIEPEAITLLSPYRLEDQVAEAKAFTPQLNLEELERRTILDAVQQADGNHSAAAILLGINRGTLIRKLNKIKEQA